MTTEIKPVHGILRGMHRRALGWLLAMASLSTVAACKGEPPTLVALDERRVVAVGETLVIVLYGSDPDGRDIDYGFSSDAPELGGSVTMSKRPDGSGLFTWSPRASHVGAWSFEFHVSAGRRKTSLPIPIEVRGAVGEGTQPIFRRPIGQGAVLSLARQDCIELEIEVEDQDSPTISLTQEPPLAPGATLDTEPNGLAGTWRWCPRKENAQSLSTYRLRLAADDGDNPKVTKDFTVAVRKRSAAASMNCPGTPPSLEHTPKDFNTVRDLEVTAAVHDDEGLARAPLLLYSTESPGDPVDQSAMQMVEMQLVSGNRRDGTWRGAIPNPLASAEGGGTTDLYYMFLIADDDDPDGSACDHVVDAPRRGTHRVSITRPADAGHEDAKEDGLALCEPCSGDLQCGGRDDLCIAPATGGEAFCSQTCDDDDDACPEGTVCSPNEVESVDGARARQCVPEAGHCSGGAAKSSCASEATNRSIDVAATLASGDRPTATMCPESGKLIRHWYRLAVEQPMQLQASLSSDGGLDFSLALVNEDGLKIDHSDTLEASEALGACLLPGTYYLNVSARPETEGDVYLLAYDLVQDAACSDASMACCEVKDTPGCADTDVESCVCEVDPYCCDVAWDGQCMAEVGALGCGQCDIEAADCCEVSYFPGCDDAAVETCVCDYDPLCCDVSNGWDPLCVLGVDLFACGSCGALPSGGNDCCDVGDLPGCNDPVVETCVCAADPFCCDPQESWDALCVSQVDSLGCGTCGSGGNAPCCEGHGMPGCDDPVIESCVCSQDPFCCQNQWDALCVSRIESYGCGSCAGESEPLCTDTCQFANDGLCDDGGPGSDYSVCEYGTDCSDCGPRDPM